MVSPLLVALSAAHATLTRPATSVPSMVKKRFEALGMVLVYSPSGLTCAKRSSRFSRGTRTWSNHSRPLSTPLSPIFSAAVLHPDARQQLALPVPQRHQQRVDAVALAVHLQLREHRGHARVLGRVADPLLARQLRGRVHHELLALRVVAGHRLHVPHVGAVAQLAHREAAGQLQRGDLRQHLAVVPLRAQEVRCCRRTARSSPPPSPPGSGRRRPASRTPR